MPKTTTANLFNLCSYFLVWQKFPLHLAKDALGKIENCKAAKCRIACGGAKAWPGRYRKELLFVLTKETILLDTAPNKGGPP
jgi:hypothetical protein